MRSGETELGKWTINYLPPSGGRYLGTLTVTNQRILFETRFDVSAITGAAVGLAGAAVAASALGLNKAYVTYRENLINVAIPKEEIKDVNAQEKFFSKKVILTLKDGSVHAFDYGMLSVKKISEVILQKG